MFAIDAKDVVKKYKNGVVALDSLSIHVDEGEIYTLLGPNGAGKSSLINILTTFYRTTSGKVTVLGKELNENANWIRTQIACVAQNISLDTHLTLLENMKFQSRMYRVNPKIERELISSLIDTFELTKYVDYPVSSYSGGVKRRLDIAMNLVSSPKILFLDEPTVGMDANSRRSMWDMLKAIQSKYKTTIFLTTHYLEEADELSDTICIMDQGKEVIQGKPSELRSVIRQNMIKISFFEKHVSKITSVMLEKLNMAKQITSRNSSLYIAVENNQEALHYFSQWLLTNNIDFSGIEIVEPSLEDVFHALTSQKEKSKGVTQ